MREYRIFFSWNWLFTWIQHLKGGVGLCSYHMLMRQSSRKWPPPVDKWPPGLDILGGRLREVRLYTIHNWIKPSDVENIQCTSRHFSRVHNPNIQHLILLLSVSWHNVISCKGKAKRCQEKWLHNRAHLIRELAKNEFWNLAKFKKCLQPTCPSS